MPVERAGKGLSGREDTDIVNERKRPPEAPAAIGPQHNLLDRGIFQCQSRHELKSVAAKPVSTQANDGRELVARMECVLSRHTGIDKIPDGLSWGQCLGRDFSHKVFIVPVGSAAKG